MSEQYYVEHPERGRLTEKGGYTKKFEGATFETLYAATRAMRRAQGTDDRGQGEVTGPMAELRVVREEA